jgi:hypothetical protein
MILWHLGMTTLAVRYVYRDPGMDLRWVMAGSLLPDLIDKPIGAVLFTGTFQAHRLFAHAVAFPVILFLVVVAVARRGSRLRKGLLGLVIGSLFHLVLDAAWVSTEAFWWPLFGWWFPVQEPASLGPLLAEMVSDPLVWAGEVAGTLYLGYLWVTRLSGGEERARFLRQGIIG